MCSTGASAAKRAANAQADAAKQTMQFAQKDWDYKQPFREQYTQYNQAFDPLRAGFMSYLSGTPAPAGGASAPGASAASLVGGPTATNPYLDMTSGFDPASFLTTPAAAPSLQRRSGNNYASMLSDIPAWQGTEITKYKPGNYASRLPSIGELDIGSVPASYKPGADLLATFDDVPDWRSVGDRLESALMDAYDINLGRETGRVTNAINSDLLRRGLGTSSVADNAQIGLDNWARRQRSLAGADALTRRLAGEAAVRDELRASALGRAGLERTAAQDELGRFATIEDMARMRRGEMTNQLDLQHRWGLEDFGAGLTGEQAILEAAARRRAEEDMRASLLRDWDLGDVAFDNDVSTRQAGLDAAIREEQRRNLWEALAWLQSDMDRVRAMGDTTSTMGSMVGASNAMGNAASNLAQIAANNGSIWGSLLGAAGMLGGAYIGRPQGGA